MIRRALESERIDTIINNHPNRLMTMSILCNLILNVYQSKVIVCLIIKKAQN